MTSERTEHESYHVSFEPNERGEKVVVMTPNPDCPYCQAGTCTAGVSRSPLLEAREMPGIVADLLGPCVCGHSPAHHYDYGYHADGTRNQGCAAGPRNGAGQRQRCGCPEYQAGTCTAGARQDEKVRSYHHLDDDCIPGAHNLPKRRTIEDWGAVTGIHVLDPDGFDRHDSKLRTRLFTETEFRRGAALSTCKGYATPPQGGSRADSPLLTQAKTSTQARHRAIDAGRELAQAVDELLLGHIPVELSVSDQKRLGALSDAFGEAWDALEREGLV